ncbi:MAG: histidinol dehydrogenase [Candidatus Melainabacteria bacterium]|nr:histidinol dehydrogenase [Candidatus Melainabacteria bacterium]
MTIVPAKVAGVKRIAVFSPPPVHRGILAACKLLKITEVYQVGGAQAIAAAAYGTDSIKPVSKVIGPGNVYVTLAKKIVFGTVGIDGLYGPSEIAILADKSANPEYVAHDLLSQLEHGSGLESAVLITSSSKVAYAVQKHVLKFAKKLPNQKTVIGSWNKNSAIIIVKDLKIGVHLINELAPEHLEILVSKPKALISRLKNAGAIFVGEYSCESIGDYVAGPSHCLPTGGSARYSSGLTVSDFIKKSSFILFNKKAFMKVACDVIELADAEGLKAHGDAVRVRLNNSKGR